MDSYRRSYDLILRHHEAWLRGVVHFAATTALATPAALAAERALWTLLGVAEEETLDALVLLRPRWDWELERLVIQTDSNGRAPPMTVVIGMVLVLWRLKKMTEARWMTFGLSSRYLIMSWLTGL